MLVGCVNKPVIRIFFKYIDKLYLFDRIYRTKTLRKYIVCIKYIDNLLSSSDRSSPKHCSTARKSDDVI